MQTTILLKVPNLGWIELKVGKVMVKDGETE